MPLTGQPHGEQRARRLAGDDRNRPVLLPRTANREPRAVRKSCVITVRPKTVGTRRVRTARLSAPPPTGCASWPTTRTGPKAGRGRGPPAYDRTGPSASPAAPGTAARLPLPRRHG
ncbi:hypothetical protein JQK87_15985, partial [Streptomyces sp. G44]|nr:hypothetical protein [Streptomyces sp. G44]